MNRISTSKKNSKDKKGKKKFKFKRLIFLVIIVILIFCGIRFGVKINQNGGGLQGFLSTILRQNEETLEDLDTIYVLVMGVSEDIETKLTDTIILCAYNPKEQTSTMLSIPRDTFVGKSKSKAKGSDKINSLYSESPEKTVEAVSKITGIDIKYYAVVNTNALIKIVDIIGGVNFDVPINMKYDDPTQNLHINLKAGMQKIDGKKAEQLLRFRHSNADKNGNMTTYSADYGADDYGRMRTQREFITETIKQTLQLKNIGKIKSLTNTIFENVETNLSVNDVLKYIPYAVNFNTENIESKQLPGVSDKYNNIWFFIYDEEKTVQMMEELENHLNGIQDDSIESSTNENTITNEIK